MDTTVKKVSSDYSPAGAMGQVYLVEGKRVAMRLWDEKPTQSKEESVRDYETVGYVMEGHAELYIEGQKILLEPGDSWLVPAGTRHRYVILDKFRAIEATSPPGHVHARDES